jgi:hypothetical protein
MMSKRPVTAEARIYERRIGDEVAAQRSEARKDPILVYAREPAVADDVGCENCGELSGLAHRVPPSKAP